MRNPKRSLWLVCVWFFFGVASGEQVRITVRDGQGGKTVPARAYLKCGGQPVFPAGMSVYRRGLEEHFLLTGDDTLDLPASPCELTVSRGLEYQPVKVSFVAGQEANVPVVVERWAALNEAGWYSADMHVHRDPKELRQILLAEDLNFAPTITYHVWSESVSQPFPSVSDFPVQVDATHIYTANSQEVERIQGGPGAVILMAKQLPIPFSGYEHYPPAIYYTRKTHEWGGFVGGDKLFWLDTFVNVALGELDFIEINCNHFLPYDVDTDLPSWSHWPVEMGYYGDREFAHWMMDSYYRILNCGLTLPLSGGSASGVKATPVGYNRVYVYLGDRPFTYENFIRALQQGKTFSTNGPIVDFKVNGQIGPGFKTNLQPGQSVRLEVAVRSRRPLDRVEIILNGRVWRSFEGQNQKKFEINEELKPEVASWIALRAFEQAEGTVVFAHTSPAYLLVDGRSVRFPEDARALIEKIDQLIEYTERKVVFRTPQHKSETLQLYRRAREVYEAVAREER